MLEGATAPPQAQTNFTRVPLPLSGARVKSDFEYLPIIRILAVRLPSVRVSVPPVPPEFSTELNFVAGGARKFAASIVSPVPKPLIVASNDCALSRMSASVPVSLMVCPAETLESK